eukprot:10062644-Ditylum_brightwellii.AAC.1
MSLLSLFVWLVDVCGAAEEESGRESLHYAYYLETLFLLRTKKGAIGASAGLLKNALQHHHFSPVY